jgi:hypothetical protein
MLPRLKRSLDTVANTLIYTLLSFEPLSLKLHSNLVSFVLAPFDLLIVLARVCSYLELDLTLCVIPSVYAASSCSLYFSKLYCVYLASRKLIET